MLFDKPFGLFEEPHDVFRRQRSQEEKLTLQNIISSQILPWVGHASIKNDRSSSEYEQVKINNQKTFIRFLFTWLQKEAIELPALQERITFSDFKDKWMTWTKAYPRDAPIIYQLLASDPLTLEEVQHACNQCSWTYLARRASEQPEAMDDTCWRLVRESMQREPNSTLYILERANPEKSKERTRKIQERLAHEMAPLLVLMPQKVRDEVFGHIEKDEEDWRQTLESIYLEYLTKQTPLTSSSPKIRL